jgi:hypothetical protein
LAPVFFLQNRDARSRAHRAVRPAARNVARAGNSAMQREGVDRNLAFSGNLFINII